MHFLWMAGWTWKRVCLSYFIDWENHKKKTPVVRGMIQWVKSSVSDLQSLIWKRVSNIFYVRSSIFNIKAFSPTGYRKIHARTLWSGYGWILRQEGWSSHHSAWEDWGEGKMQHITDKSHINNKCWGLKYKRLMTLAVSYNPVAL